MCSKTFPASLVSMNQACGRACPRPCSPTLAKSWKHAVPSSLLWGHTLTQKPPVVTGWPETLFKFFHKMFQKNPNEIFGQPSTCLALHSLRSLKLSELEAAIFQRQSFLRDGTVQKTSLEMAMSTSSTSSTWEGPSHLSSPNKQNQSTQDITVYMISNSLTGSPRSAVPLILIIIEEKNRSASRPVVFVPLCTLLEAQFLVERCVFHDTNEQMNEQVFFFSFAISYSKLLTNSV